MLSLIGSEDSEARERRRTGLGEQLRGQDDAIGSHLRLQLVVASFNLYPVSTSQKLKLAAQILALQLLPGPSDQKYEMALSAVFARRYCPQLNSRRRRLVRYASMIPQYVLLVLPKVLIPKLMTGPGIRLLAPNVQRGLAMKLLS